MGIEKEKITRQDGVPIWLSREVVSIEPESEFRIKPISVADVSLIPDNYNDANAGPMRIVQGEGIGIDLNKRRQAMSFWHRNTEHDELIFCYQGGAVWETELGDVELHAGEMIVIPRGVAHRDKPLPGEQYIAIEMKISTRLKKLV